MYNKIVQIEYRILEWILYLNNFLSESFSYLHGGLGKEQPVVLIN